MRRTTRIDGPSRYLRGVERCLQANERVKSIFAYRIWLDTNNVWNDDRKVEGADPETFERIGTSEFGYYRDSERVYSYFGRLKVVEGADLRTFQIPAKR